MHPFKYLLYLWLPAWQAFNLDTVLSVWLTGFGTYLWLRRHVGPAGALTGAAVFGLSGYVWGHLIHTSMINALASVPFVILALEWSWESGRWRGPALGGLALAVQVFAGHLQDSLLTGGLVVFYGLYRAATEQRRSARVRSIAMAIALVAIGVLISAVQWVPSKELLDRSPRAGGLLWKDLTYGSWGPELLPTLVMREAYGTRAQHRLDRRVLPLPRDELLHGLDRHRTGVRRRRRSRRSRPLVSILGALDRMRVRADARQVHFSVRLCPPGPGAGQLARAGAFPPLGVAGNRRAGKRRRRAAWPRRPCLAPRRSDRGGCLGLAFDSDHDVCVSTGLARAQALDADAPPRSLPVAGS